MSAMTHVADRYVTGDSGHTTSKLMRAVASRRPHGFQEWNAMLQAVLLLFLFVAYLEM